MKYRIRKFPDGYSAEVQVPDNFLFIKSTRWVSINRFKFHYLQNAEKAIAEHIQTRGMPMVVKEIEG